MLKLTVLDVRFFLTECRTRIPFRFGMVTLERAPLCLAQVEVETEEGDRCRGYASDLLVPKWFEKDPDKPLLQDSVELLESALAADRIARENGARPESAFALWHRLYRSHVESVPPSASDRLVRGFGVSLLERATLDALCRNRGLGFFAALRADLFGFRPGEVHPELAELSLADLLPARPLEVIEVRHTVGLLDTLRSTEVSAQERGDDHPLSLEEDIERHGLRLFKIKVSGEHDQDLARLLAVAEVLDERCASDFAATLDGNEQFASPPDLRRLLDQLARTPCGARLLERIRYIEQPLARARSLDPAVVGADALDCLDDFGGVILDEADSGVAAFPRAIELGYRGISVKNCKGLFRALLNRGLCLTRSTPERPLFQSSEDLTNLPIFALQQDLTTAASLGLEHSERNGHHYFRGLEHLSPHDVKKAVSEHPDLYATEPSPRLRIRGGRLEIGSLQCPGYGARLEPDLDALIPAADWLAGAAPAIAEERR